MKNINRLPGIIVLTAIIVFGMAACDNSTSPGTDPCAGGHAFPAWAAPSCTEAGNSTRTCTNAGCDVTDTRTTGFAALGHSMQPAEGSNLPTCTEDGYGGQECANCEYTVGAGDIPMLGHTFTEWEETTPATCLDAAIDTEKCAVCDTLGTVTDEGHHALGHSAGAVGGATEATCEDDGYTGTGTCIRCSIELTGEAIDAFGHHYHDWTAPTCTTAGNSERECTNDCGTIDTRDKDYAALGHQGTIAAFAATCTTAGNSALSGNCVRFAQCGYVVTGTVIPAGHKWIVTTPPNFTAETDGEANCSACSTNQVYKFYKIGDTGPAGGIIFYVADGEDGRPDGITIQGYGTPGNSGYFAAYTAYYLEAAPTSEINSPWQATSDNTDNTLIDGITTWANTTAKDAGLAASIGVGRKDTQTIVNSAAFAELTNTAAQRCASKVFNGFRDWFLPSLGELNEMYKAGVAGVTGIPRTGQFWSSSQSSSYSAWDQFLVDGTQYDNYKRYTRNVRAVRAF